MKRRSRDTPFSLRAARWAVWITVVSFLAVWLVVTRMIPDRDAGFGLGGDFTLQGPRGPISTRDLRGKVVLVYFGYTFCPDVCPTTLAEVGQALKLLGEDELARTRVLFVSVDPERDTPERLSEYTAYFHPRIVGVTGPVPELAQIASRYGATFQKRALPEGEGYAMDHPVSLYVLDPAGKLVALVPHGASIEHVRDVIRAVLRGQPVPKKVYK
jgi:protein SCO1/2